MTRPRAPRLAGVAGGVGTTTLAAALRGHDRGRVTDRGADVLVCRSTGDSLHAAATAVSWIVSVGCPPPVLAVVADQPVPVRGPSRARLRMIEPTVAGLVLVPYVTHWRDLTDPLAEAVRLAGCPADDLPRPLRAYAESLGGIAAAVLASGLLSHDPGGDTAPPPANRATGPIRRVPARSAPPTRSAPPGPPDGTATPDRAARPVPVSGGAR